MRLHHVLLPLLLAALWMPAPHAAAIAERSADERSDDAAEHEKDREELRRHVRDILQRLYKARPQAKEAVEKAAGYAVFRNFGMKILITGGGSGKGIAVDRETDRETFMRMAEIQAGLGFGAKRFDLVWVFGTREAFRDFLDNGVEFGGQSTFAAKSRKRGGALAGAMQVGKETWVYQLTEAGLAAEFTLKGTKYYRDRKLNE